MKKIFKYILLIDDLQTLHMPNGAEILDVQMQYGNACLWALCDPTQPHVPRGFAIYGTGLQMPNDPGKYISTFQEEHESGLLVWHLFETTP